MKLTNIDTAWILIKQGAIKADPHLINQVKKSVSAESIKSINQQNQTFLIRM